MTPARLQKIDELFQAAVARPAEERDAFLEEACAGEESLRREVEALIAADSETDDFAQVAKASPLNGQPPTIILISSGKRSAVTKLSLRSRRAGWAKCSSPRT
jgi:hypothetical protein